MIPTYIQYIMHTAYIKYSSYTNIYSFFTFYSNTAKLLYDDSSSSLCSSKVKRIHNFIFYIRSLLVQIVFNLREYIYICISMSTPTPPTTGLRTSSNHIIRNILLQVHKAVCTLGDIYSNINI